MMTNKIGEVLLIIVFLCFLIHAKNGESYGTIGFDVHHRYSDTVKDFLDLDELPQKGTVDYYTAMAHRDHLFTARRLAGGSDGSGATSPPPSGVLTFFGGSRTYRLRALGFLHYALVTVGTPVQGFLVALDTGSDLFWLPCECTSCARSYNTSSGTPISLNIYTPSNSTTSSPIPCNSTLCGPRRGCAVRRNACTYRETYLSSNTSSTGILVDEILHLSPDEDSFSLTDAQITLGCGMIQSGGFLEAGGINGLLGLGMDNISVPSTLARKGLIAANSLSMCFGPDGLGRIEFGDRGSSDQKTTPFNLGSLPPTYNVTITQIAVGIDVTNVTFTALFDSGTSFAYLNDPVYSVLVEAFDSQVSEPHYRPQTDNIFDYCYALSSDQETYYTPDLNLTMEGGAQFYVTAPTTIMIRQLAGGFAYCLAVMKSDDINIIGQNFMTGYRLVFDRDEMVLGWKESDCSDSNTTTNVPPVNNSAAPPPSSTPRNRTLTPLSPPPSTIPLSGNNAENLSSMSTNILMALIIFISFRQFMDLYP